ncbi:uncharacterized protein LOC144438902 isoform X3 [Glandiceps talaboti]
MASVVCRSRNLVKIFNARWQQPSSSCFIRWSSGTLTGKTVRIGCASGFWGDTACAAPQLVNQGNIDYLVFDYLSEITMSLLTAARQKVPKLGYTPDFVSMTMAPLLKEIKKQGIKVVSNAGGVNPHGCLEALQDIAKKLDVSLKIAIVTGDDLMPLRAELGSLGVTDMKSGLSLPKTVHSMNAYLGASPIAKALELGADIVITGRCVDSAVVLGPLMYEFGWKSSDYDLLAAGSLAGHLVECGAQATGGIFTDWHTVPAWDNIGFPIVECAVDGKFILTKPPKTGGLVSFGTVAEQLVYEIGDPKKYILPDVNCDFSQVQIKEIKGQEKEAVFVQGAKGLPPSNEYKVSATYADGFRVTAVCPLGGPWASKKAHKTAEAILTRTRRMLKQLGMDDFTKTLVQVLGSEQTYGPNAHIDNNPREVVLWVAAHHSNKKALEVLSREVAPAGTGMAPGFMTLIGGRPRVSPVLKLFSFLYSKDKVQVKVDCDGQEVEISCPILRDSGSDSQNPDISSTTEEIKIEQGSSSFRVGDLAYTRSGDKGNTANIVCFGQIITSSRRQV